MTRYCRPRVEDVPEHLWISILQTMEARDVGAFMRASTECRALASCSQLWSQAIIRVADGNLPPRYAVHLDLVGNKSVAEFADRIHKFLNLTSLQIRSNPGEHPNAAIRFEPGSALRRLRVGGDHGALHGLGNLTNLRDLHLDNCDHLRAIGELAAATGLIRLELRDCANLTDTKGLADMTGLQELVLTACRNVSVLDGLASLKALRKIDLEECTWLEHLDGLDQLASLRNIRAVNCAKLRGAVARPRPRFAPTLVGLAVRNCASLGAPEDLVGPLHGLTAMRFLSVEGFDARMTNLHGLQGMADLRRLLVADCPSLGALEGMTSHMTALRVISLVNCGGVTSLNGLGGLGALQALSVLDCDGVAALPGLGSLTSLQDLAVSNCPNLTALEDIDRLVGMTKLHVSMNPGLANHPRLPGPSLQKLFLSGSGLCSCIPPSLPAIVDVNVCDCEHMAELRGLRNWTTLEALKLYWCENLTGLDGLSRLTALRQLHVIGCPGIGRLDCVSALTNLTDLRFV